MPSLLLQTHSLVKLENADCGWRCCWWDCRVALKLCCFTLWSHHSRSTLHPILRSQQSRYQSYLYLWCPSRFQSSTWILDFMEVKTSVVSTLEFACKLTTAALLFAMLKPYACVVYVFGWVDIAHSLRVQTFVATSLFSLKFFLKT